MDDMISKIDALMEKSCYLIDIFPCTVPETPDRRYFMVEEYFQKSRGEINRKFCGLLLKLYCYYDFFVLAGETSVENPEPDQLAQWIGRCLEGDWREGDSIHILLPDRDAMLILDSDDLYMSLYNPDKRLLEMVSRLAGAEGLFVYKAPGAQR